MGLQIYSCAADAHPTLRWMMSTTLASHLTCSNCFQCSLPLITIDQHITSSVFLFQISGSIQILRRPPAKDLMFARVGQVTRHFSRPILQNGGQLLTSRSTMAAPNTKRQIHTAGIIIIGDEVLGGKVSNNAYTNVASPRQC